MMGPPANSRRLMIGSFTSWGRFWRIWAIALRTSLVARSLSVPKTKLTTVLETPSLTVEIMLSILPKPAIASSTFFVTWASSSVGPAPGWVTVTETAGKSIFGLASIPSSVKENQPTTVKTKNRTIVGTGFRIDQVEMLKDIYLLFVVCCLLFDQQPRN